MPTAEGDNQRRFMRSPADKAAYLAYRERTSPVLPLPPALYAALPRLVKQVLLLELPMYETDWAYEGWAEGVVKVIAEAAAPTEAAAAGGEGSATLREPLAAAAQSGGYQAS